MGADALQDLQSLLDGVSPRVAQALSMIDPPLQRVYAEDLEAQSAAPGFWDDAAAAEGKLRRLAGHKAALEQAERWEASISDARAAIELADVSLMVETASALETLEAELAAWETRSLMSGEYDSCGAVLTLTAGAGGVDAMDWTEMLLRMYTRWGEGMTGYRVTLTERSDGEEAGIKSATLTIDGSYAYGHLRSERGMSRPRPRP